jgi:hypothetical protein
MGYQLWLDALDAAVRASEVMLGKPVAHID